MPSDWPVSWLRSPGSPSPTALRTFLSEQSKLTFSYSEVGTTATLPPSGHVVDHTRIKLGNGVTAFLAARTALERWEHFRLGWVETWPPETPIKAGEVVAIIAHRAGIWWLNACRIVYVVDEHGPVDRYGFAYGTLPGHVEKGEERFLIESNRESGEVSYDILAFSRPRHLWMWLGYPYIRRLQKQFARESAAAMVLVVQTIAEPEEPMRSADG